VTRITLDMPPSANRYWRMGNNRIYRSDEATHYKTYVGLICNTAGIEPVDGDVRVVLRFFRPAKRGDLDNRIKVTLDSLQGHFYHDDKQIVEIHAMRCDDKANPRVEIEVTPL
jgi:Holliday junction resolvase RusA-like endonuclease